MHEEMHMTHMQFMNTGAREIVSLLDTTSWGRAYVFKEVTRTFRWFAKERGSRQNPCMMHMRKAQHGDVHNTTIFTKILIKQLKIPNTNHQTTKKHHLNQP